MHEKVIDTLSAQEMVDWANAAIDRISEMEAEVKRLRADLVEQHKEWLVHSEVLAQQRDDNIHKIQKLRDALYEIAHMDPIRRIQGDAQRVAKKALEIK